MLNQNCSSDDGVPSYTLSAVAIGSGLLWLCFHIPSLRRQYLLKQQAQGDRRKKLKALMLGIK